MASPIFDKAAEDVIAGAGGYGAVRFEGWLGPNAAAPDDTRFRLFTDAHFMTWLEIAADDLLHQIPGVGVKTEHPEGKSIIWVKREARITRCQSGAAFWFDQMGLEVGDHTTWYGDPTGADRPRGFQRHDR